MSSISWTCPHCNKPTTVGNSDIHSFQSLFTIDNKHGPKIIKGAAIVCPNIKCKEYTLTLSIHNMRWESGWKQKGLIKSWNLIPQSRAKPFPAYVPSPIVADYHEACLILDGSAKASATLSRRCLQGMIRDFWGVKRPENYKGLWRLKEEIESIKDKVEPETWAAIDGVRKIGNIGAHMEEDINVIVDVEPEEADKLIWLIEILIKDWYVNKHERQVRLEEIATTANSKKAPKK